ncbi:MAG: dihydroorotate dehydrogenase [Syntrophales bacterium]|jgi:dihydroorotate dehydrogenase (NAD+) catalytic subunit|nr:dihydroorotate dehydrogenase [Syntrophales bacterium]MDX9922184.1 dihydroorotate dehydrogenase [Syntrophales bacterium]
MTAEKPVLPNMAVSLGGIEMKNPVMTASGTFGYGQEYESYLDLNRLGGIVVKGISPQPRTGNRPPRIMETSSGMLNAIGLENVGLEVFLAEKAAYLRSLNTAVIVNIFGETIEDYVRVAEGLDGCDGIAGLEVNISCPNVKKGGVDFGSDPDLAGEVVSAVRNATRLPLIVKLTPNVTDIRIIARSVEKAGADAISLINTIKGMAIDVDTRRPRLGNVTGGLSGPAIKPVALRMVWETARAVSVPLIGMGGIMNSRDALEFLIAGARAVQVGTANFINPAVTIEIIDGIREYLIAGGFGDVNDIVGSLRL